MSKEIDIKAKKRTGVCCVLDFHFELKIESVVQRSFELYRFGTLECQVQQDPTRKPVYTEIYRLYSLTFNSTCGTSRVGPSLAPTDIGVILK